MNSLGARIKAEREAKGWTQTQLGKILGITGASVNRYEADARSPDPDMLTRLADLFVVSVDYLLGRSREMELPANVQAILRTSKQLTDAERQSILDFIEFTRAQRRKRGEHVPGDPVSVPEDSRKE